MRRFHAIALLFALGGLAALHAEGLNPAAQARLDQIRDEAAKWAVDPLVVQAVVAQNRQLPPELAAMTQEKWEALPEKSSALLVFTTHPVVEFIRTQGAGRITEAFVSDAAGRKVAFLAKTTSWSHLGKPKHDVPMTGKAWQGKLEVDRSAGTQQIQVSVPVLADGVPVGSLVIGVPVSALAGS